MSTTQTPALDPVRVRLTDDAVRKAERRARGWKKAPRKFNAGSEEKRLLNAAGAHEAVIQHFGRRRPVTLVVRHTPVPDWDLKVNPSDPDDGVYLLVTGTLSSRDYELVGWASGRECKRADWWEPERFPIPTYLVPRSALHPVPRVES